MINSITIESTGKVTAFFAHDKDGNRYRWSFWRDAAAGYWMLRDCDGYVRTMERTWTASVPRIQGTLANYDMTATIS